MTVILVGVLGFALGVLVGIVMDDAWELLWPGRKFRMPFSTRPHRIMSTLLLIALVGNLATGVLLFITRSSANDYYACMAQWQQDQAKAQNSRVQTNIPVQAALDDIVKAVDSRDNEAIGKAVHAYVALRQDQIAVQKKNPPPPLPSNVCGNPELVRR